MTLNEVVAPMALSAFERECLGEKYCVIKGAPARFRDLVTWDDLDEALSHLRVSDNRVSLVQDGRNIPRDAYVLTSQSGKSEYLDGPSLAGHVAAGATLVVNQVDELFTSVRELAESCEEIFQVYVTVNLYAGWRTSKGFDIHWDRHDTLILQLVGRKDWRVWNPTLDHPLPGGGSLVPKPIGSPEWQGILEDGDALYMPRGWWHVACPLDEPSLHLTVTIKHPTGMDYANWVLEQLKDVRALRLDVPHWRDVREQEQWAAEVRDALLGAFERAAPAQFMRHLAARAHTRPIIRLPQTAISLIPTRLEPQTKLRLTRGRALEFTSTSAPNMTTVTAGNGDWQCPAALTPALRMLNHVRPCAIFEMEAALDASARDFLVPFLTALLAANVVWAEKPRERSAAPVRDEAFRT